ncbi:hypothetical protein ABZ826_16245 [Streptomyces sp. NPDC047515]
MPLPLPRLRTAVLVTGAALTDSERDDSMLICVSRCRGKRLVLDL